MVIQVNNEKLSKEYDFFIQWHLTEKCNLRCSHCYQSETCNDELSFNEIKAVIAEVSDMLNAWTADHGISFSRTINVTGGEPFLRPDFFRILEEIRNYGFEIYVLSNGTLIDREKAYMLSKIGISGIQISIEGPESLHDIIRGKGSYDQSVKGVQHLLDSCIDVTLNMTLSNMNYNYLKEMISIAENMGVQKLGFSRLVPTGRGKQFIGEMIDTDKIKELYDSLRVTDVKGLDIVTGDPVASQNAFRTNENLGYTAYGGCAAGISGLTLRPDGTINPCRRLSIPIGDVLNQLRDKKQYNEKCRTCKRWAGCRGCRAIAYAYSQSRGGNDFLAEDPQCFMHENQVT
jgi:radical SAM protein with 4Fe4S-binding SPASM domain